MTSISFAFHLGKDRYNVDVSFNKTARFLKKNEMKNAIKIAVSQFLSTEKPKTTDLIQVEIGEDLTTKVRIANRNWRTISVDPSQPMTNVTLQRSMRSSVPIDKLASSSTLLGMILNFIGEKLSSFFQFVTGTHQKPPVDVALLQEIAGAFAENGTVTMHQALAYWITNLEQNEIPSEETQKLLHLLQKCSTLAERIETITSLHGEQLESEFRTLTTSVLADVKALADKDKIIIPVGFWKALPSQNAVFQDCLMEITKKNDSYALSLFSIEEASFEKTKSLITTHTIDEAQLNRDLPLILALPFPQKHTALQNHESFIERYFAPVLQEAIDSQQRHTTSTEELQHLFGYDTKVPASSQGRPSLYTSATKVVKSLIRHELAPQKTEKEETINYKILRVHSELDLLKKATTSDAWVSDRTYRNVVFHTARKLLSDIVGVKKQVSLTQRLTEEARVPRDVLQQETKWLETLLDKISAYAKKEVEISANASPQRFDERPVNSSPPLEPTHTTTIQAASFSGIDLASFIPPGPQKTFQDIQQYLNKVSKVCEQLVKSGRYEILEKSIPMICTHLSLDVTENLLQHISGDEALELSRSVTNLQKTIGACFLTNPTHAFHPTFMLAVPLFEILHDQIIVALDKETPPPLIMNTDIYMPLQAGNLSYFRSPEMLQRIQELQRYVERRAPIQDPSDKNLLLALAKQQSSVHPRSRIRQEALKAVFLNTLSNPNGCIFSRTYYPLECAFQDRSLLSELSQFKRGRLTSDEVNLVRAKANVRNIPLSRAHKNLDALKGRRLSTLPEVTLLHYSFGNPYPGDHYELYLPEAGLIFQPQPHKRDDEVESPVFQSFRMYSPAAPTKVLPTADERQVPEIRRVDWAERFQGFDAALDHFAWENKTQERAFLRGVYVKDAVVGPFSRDEVIAIQTLSPMPIPDNGTKRAAIANLLKLASFHPNLLSHPQVKLFIYRTILQPGVMDTVSYCSEMSTAINELFKKITSLREVAHKSGSYADEIQLISLLGTLSARIPKTVRDTFPLANRDWIIELERIRGLIKEKPSLRRLFSQEYLGLVVASKRAQFFIPQSAEELDYSQIFSEWIYVNGSKKRSPDDDPGILKESESIVLTILSQMKSWNVEQQQQVLDRVFSTLNISLPIEQWNLSDFPTCRKGNMTIQLDRGIVWKDNAISCRLPQEIENSSVFQKTHLPPRAIWKITQSTDKATNTPISIYTIDKDPTIRILSSLDGVHFFIQKKIDGNWYNAVEPTLDTAHERQANRQRSEAAAFQKTVAAAKGIKGFLLRLATRYERFARPLKRMISYERAPDQENAPPVPENTVMVNTTLYSLVKDDLVYIEATPYPSKIHADTKTYGHLIINLSSSGAPTSVSSELGSFGALPEEARPLFSAIDERTATCATWSSKKVLFPFVHLRGSKRTEGLAAKKVGSSWEYEDEMLSGYKLLGQQQPEDYTAAFQRGAFPIIPPEITSFHLLENRDGKQKVLIPMNRLTPVAPQHAPGTEPETRKQFSRFTTAVRKKEDESLEDPTVLFCFDIVDGVLTSNDPLANAYLAFLYTTQQRYEDALRYLELSHTNFPDSTLIQQYKNILEWQDTSQEFQTVKRKACLLQVEWPQGSGLSRDEILKKIFLSYSNVKDEGEYNNSIRKLFENLDEKDKSRLLFILKKLESYSYIPVEPIPRTSSLLPETQTHPRLRTSIETGSLAESLLLHMLAEDTPLPTTFFIDLALHPDETIMTYYLPLLNLTRMKGNAQYQAAIQNAQVRMSDQGKVLATILLDEFNRTAPFLERGQEVPKIEFITILKESFAQKCSDDLEDRKGSQRHTQKPKEVNYTTTEPLKRAFDGWVSLTTVYTTTPAKPTPVKPIPEVPYRSLFPFHSPKDILQDMLKATNLGKVDLSAAPHQQSKARKSLFPKEFDYALSSETTPIDKAAIEAKTIQFFRGVTAKTADNKEIPGMAKKRESLQDDTNAHILEEQEKRLFITSQTEKARKHLQDKELALQETQKQLRKTIFLLVNQTSEDDLEQLKRALTPTRRYVHFERLLGSYVRSNADLGDLKELLHRYNVDVDAQHLNKLLREYLECSIALSHTKATLTMLPKNKTDFSEEERREIGSTLEAHRFFEIDDTPRSRLLLMLEYSCGFLLRKGNISLVDRILENPNCISQLPPGSGKTAVVLRLLAVLRANGTNLSTLILPEWLYEQNRKDLDRGLKALFGQDLFCLDIPETRDLTAPELEEILARVKKTIVDKGVMLTTRLSLLTLKNSFEHIGRQLTEEVKNHKQTSQTLQTYTKMAQLISLFRERMVALCDEVDSILDIHREVNRKESKEKELPSWQQGTGFLLYSLLVEEKDTRNPLGKLAQGIFTNTQVDLAKKDIDDGLEMWADRLLDKKNISANRTMIKAYILQKKVGDSIPDLPADLSQELRETFVAAKSFLSHALPFSTLTKANNTKDGYGRFNRQVVPYAGPGQPEEHSEFCDPFEIISFTIQDYLYKGIDKNQALALATQLNVELNKEWMKKGLTTSRKDLETYKEALHNFSIDIEEMHHIEDENALAEYVQRKVNSTFHSKLIYCKNYVLPEIKTTQDQVQSDAFDLVDMTAQFAGMTATPYNAHTYHDRISKENATTLGSDGKALAAVMRKDIGISVIALHETEPLSGHLMQRSCAKTYQGIIDIGAYCKEKAPEDLAADMANRLPKESKTRYIVYVDRSGKIVAYDKKYGKVVPFDEKTIPIEERRTIYQIFIGTDIAQDPKAKFLVTIGNLNFLKDFIQGVMRLRGLSQDQSFDIVLTPEVEATIRSVTGTKEPTLTLQDILSYCVKNELESAKKDTLSAERRKIQRTPTITIQKALVRLSSQQYGPTAETVATIHEKLGKWIAPRTSFDLDTLSKVQTEKSTTALLEDLKRTTIDELEEILTIVETLPENTILKEEVTQAKERLQHRNFTDPSLMPDKSLVLPGGEEIGQKATAIEQQQTTQLAMATVYERRTDADRQEASLTPWENSFKTLRYPYLDAAYKIFHTDLSFSTNIIWGWGVHEHADLSYALYDPIGLHLVILDKTQMQLTLNEMRPEDKESLLIIGPEISFIRAKIPEDQKKHFYDLIIQVKLIAGFVDFESEVEKEALKRLIGHGNGQISKEELLQFMEFNTKHYLSENSYERFKNGTCTLAQLTRTVS